MAQSVQVIALQIGELQSQEPKLNSWKGWDILVILVPEDTETEGSLALAEPVSFRLTDTVSKQVDGTHKNGA